MTESFLYRSEENLEPADHHIEELKGLQGEFLTGYDLPYSLLVGNGDKRGTDITFNSELDPNIENYIEVMTDLGANVFVDYNACEGRKNAEVLATTRDLEYDEFLEISGRDIHLSESNQMEKARTRGFPEEAIEWYYNENELTLAPSKLRGLYDTNVDGPFMIAFGIKPEREVFERYAESYGIPRIEALEDIERSTGREVTPDPMKPESFWNMVEKGEMPFQTQELQTLLQEEKAK